MVAAAPERKEPTGAKRRQSELALVAWENTLAQLGRSPTLDELFAAIDTEEWSYGFIVAVDPDVEISSLLSYGSNFARLLDMPERGMPFVKMTRQLPPRYGEIFLRGCTEAYRSNMAAQLEGTVEREDGRRELFRVVFIPVERQSDTAMRLAIGRFNCRIAEPEGGC